uniref:Uncharacterized protein n=1 Tax=Anopheles culicifacies TaxID=139723 RepID=A0A182LTL2_9DIPT
MGNRLGALFGIEKAPGSSGADTGGTSSKNYNLIESTDRPAPRLASSDLGQSPLEPTTSSPGSRLNRVRSFFLPSFRGSSTRRRDGSDETTAGSGFGAGGRTGSRRRFRFYTIRRRTEQQLPAKESTVVGAVGGGKAELLEGGANESLLSAGQKNVQRTNQWIHRFPLEDGKELKQNETGDADLPDAVPGSSGETKVCLRVMCLSLNVNVGHV